MRYSFKDLSIDITSRSVSRDGKALKLPELSFELLLALVQSAPAILSREQLSNTVWRKTHVSDETIAQRIKLLRKSLDDDPKNPRYIRTIRGRGYTLLGAVSGQAELFQATVVPRFNMKAAIAVILFFCVSVTLIVLIPLESDAPTTEGVVSDINPSSKNKNKNKIGQIRGDERRAF